MCHPVVLGKGEAQDECLEEEDEEEEDGRRADLSKQLLRAVPHRKYCCL